MSPAAIAFWLIAIFVAAAVVSTCAALLARSDDRLADVEPEPTRPPLYAVHEDGHTVAAERTGNVVRFTPDRAGRWHVEEGSAS